MGLAVLAAMTSLRGDTHAESGAAEKPLNALSVTITSAMADRFGPGYDRNRDGRPDLPNSYEYVNPGGYELKLAAGVDATDVAEEDLACDWTIDGTAPVWRPECRQPARE